MTGQRFQEGLKTRHTGVLDPPDPATEFPLGLTFGQGHVVDVGEGLAEGMGLRESGGTGEEPGADPPFVGAQFGFGLAQDPLDVLERAVLGFRQVALEPTLFLFAQRLDGVTIQARDMEAIGADGDVRAEDGPGRTDETAVQVGAHHANGAPRGFGDGAQKRLDARALALFEHGEDAQGVLDPGADDHHEVAVAFGQGDLVEPEHGQRRERRPIDPARDVPIEDAFELLRGDGVLVRDVFEGAVDQGAQQAVFEGTGEGAARVVPVQPLGGGGMVVAKRTAIAFGSNDNVGAMLEDRRMAQPPFLAESMRLGDASTAAPALRAVFGAVHMNFQHTHVRDFDAVDGDLLQSEQAQELALINHRLSIE